MGKHISIPKRAEVASELETSEQYLYQIETRRRRPSRLMALAIERATAGAVTRHDLRPDLYPPEAKASPLPDALPETAGREMV